MPHEDIIPAGAHRVRKRFRNEEDIRYKQKVPWKKRILDLENKQILERTPLGWLRIIGFYLLLYFLIALIVAFWIVIYIYVILKPGRPVWLKSAPGISIVPRGMHKIDFHPHIQTEIDPIADNIDKFFDNIDESSRSLKVFQECNRDSTWGYYKKEPCVFIKLNNVYGFEAVTYDASSELPDDSPTELGDLMIQYSGSGKIWLTCDAKDEETSPSINYLPYPYYDTNSDMKGLNRVIGLHITDLPTNQDVTIICKVWAKNIDIDMKNRGNGHTTFTLNMRVLE
ncbi:hypothetical protein KR093_003797 [Drosophila rubida]|uniref:Sodium/potassium-transporting ATPase subunit beta-1 n=1 Tax=Drosophila rubida TaxID=30044 RepID=A0AAD4PGT3_9MUSC|nr:hypothetical protein KR093_003797 [Drosophila rubida]